MSEFEFLNRSFGIDVKVTPKNFTHTNEDIINESDDIENEDIKGVNDNV